MHDKYDLLRILLSSKGFNKWEKQKELLYTPENQLKLLFAYFLFYFPKFVCVNMYFLVIFQSYHY